MTKEKVKSILESLMFVMGEPVPARTAAELLNMPTSDIVKIFRDLADDYEERGSGIRIREMDKSFQFCTSAENDDYIQKLCTPVKVKRLSQSALEVLAIIAYKQPVTKTQIDSIRGIRSDRVIESLMKRGLIEEQGRSSSIGRPYLYGTTRYFLELFGFETLSELPEIENIDSIVLDEEDFEEPMPDQLTIEESETLNT